MPFKSYKDTGIALLSPAQEAMLLAASPWDSASCRLHRVCAIVRSLPELLQCMTGCHTRRPAIAWLAMRGWQRVVLAPVLLAPQAPLLRGRLCNSMLCCMFQRPLGWRSCSRSTSAWRLTQDFAAVSGCHSCSMCAGAQARRSRRSTLAARAGTSTVAATTRLRSRHAVPCTPPSVIGRAALWCACDRPGIPGAPHSTQGMQAQG